MSDLGSFTSYVRNPLKVNVKERIVLSEIHLKTTGRHLSMIDKWRPVVLR